MLETKYQGAKLLYVATHKTPARDLRVQNVMHDISLKIVHKWSIKVADLYTEGNFNGFLPQYQHDYSYDQVDQMVAITRLAGLEPIPTQTAIDCFTIR